MVEALLMGVLFACVSYLQLKKLCTYEKSYCERLRQAFEDSISWAEFPFVNPYDYAIPVLPPESPRLDLTSRDQHIYAVPHLTLPQLVTPLI